MPLCVLGCLFHGKLRRHRHCPSCNAVITGSDEKYADHAWQCTGGTS